MTPQPKDKVVGQLGGFTLLERLPGPPATVTGTVRHVSKPYCGTTNFTLELTRARDGRKKIGFHVKADSPDKKLLRAGAKVRITFDSSAHLELCVRADKIRKAS